MRKFLFVLLFSASVFSALTFVQQPSINYNSGNRTWQISFSLSEYSDVEVSIVRLSDSSIVRRLAAGMLGAGAPAPFAANSLTQTLAWDGKDDLGNPVSDTLSISVRVRAGMSVKLDALIGNNPYYFSSVNGAALASDGSIYVYGVYGAWGNHLAIRKYDAAGTYVKTVYPYPSGVDTGLVFGWGSNWRADDTYVPKYTFYPALKLSTSMVAAGAKILPFPLDNKPTCYKIVSHWPNPNKLEIVQIGDNSSIGRNGGQVPLITSPVELPNAGALLMTQGPDQNFIFIGGAYKANDLGSYVYSVADTGFWQDGRVYRLNKTTGVTDVWHTFVPMDSIPDFGAARYNSGIGPVYNGHPYAQLDFSAVHGVAFDKAGHVLVCDRVRGEVGIYDTITFAKVSSIPVPYPHQVDVNPSTGEIYVLCRHLTGYNIGIVHLRKYSGWQNPVLVASMDNFLPVITHYQTLIRMVVSYGGARPVIWLTEATVWAVQDDGANFTVLKKFKDLAVEETAARVPQTYERLAVDRKTETLYITDGWSGFYKIKNWADPKAVQCSTSSNQVLLAGEAAVSPDGFLYIRDDLVGTRGGGFSGKIVRYTLDNRHATSVFPGTGTNVVDANYYGRYGIAYGDKGIAVSRTGNVAFMDMVSWVNYDVVQVNADGSRDDSLIFPLSYGMASGRLDLPYNCGGLKFDYDGNVYVGALVRPKGSSVPAGFSGDATYPKGVGSVVKFPAAGGSFSHDSAVGAIKVYDQEFGGFSGLDHFCQCRSPRFDLDPYGRLFIPNALSSEVAVCDNSGNNILKFGSYGNADQRGALGGLSGPAIPLATPLCAAASDNFIYVSDINNARLARLQMNFVLDNIPQIKKAYAELAARPAALSITASPNPFTPVSRITLRLPQKSAVRLQVCDISGRVVRTLRDGDMKAGVHQMAWDARDGSNRPVAAGIYVYRLTAANRTMIVKTILAK